MGEKEADNWPNSLNVQVMTSNLNSAILPLKATQLANEEPEHAPLDFPVKE